MALLVRFRRPTRVRVPFRRVRWWALHALVWVLVLVLGPPMAGLAQSAEGWSSFQGGTGHLGDAPSLGAAPPLHAAWKADAGTGGGEAPTGAVIGAGVAIAVGETRVAAFDPSTGHGMWTLARARGFPVQAAVDPSAGPHGTVVYAEGDGARTGVVAIDLSSQARLWRLSLRQRVLSAPTVEGGRVFFGAQDQRVYAVDLTTGQVVWKAPTQGLVDTSPAVAAGKVMVVSESLSIGVRVYALDQATGKVDWSFSRPPSSERSSSITTDGRVAYVGLSDRTVQALDVATGRVLWSQPVPVAFTPATAPALSGGSVFAADADGGLYRFDALTGKRLWDFQLPSAAIASRAAPLVSKGVVFLGSSDGTLGAIEIATGQLIWKSRFGAGPVGLLTPDGDHLLVSILGRRGGVVAMDHDPNGTLIREDSPTDLNIPAALSNYAVGFVLVLGGAWLLFGYLPVAAGRRAGVGLDGGTDDGTPELDDEPEPAGSSSGDEGP